MTSLARLPFAALLLAFAAHLSAAPGADASYVAKVNGVAISNAAFAKAMARARAAGQPDSPQVRQAIAQRLIAEELFWQEAKKQKFDKSPEANAAADDARRQAAIRLYLLRSVKVTEPTEAEVKQRYQRIVANLGPNEYRISLIQTADENALREAAKRIGAGADFATEARRVSKAPSATRGGELDWVSFPLPPAAGHTNGLPLAVAEAVADMKPGQVSAPLRIDQTWALVRLDAVRPTLIPAYEQVAATVRKAALAAAADQAARALAQQVLGKARIETPNATPSKESQQ